MMKLFKLNLSLFKSCPIDFLYFFYHLKNRKIQAFCSGIEHGHKIYRHKRSIMDISDLYLNRLKPKIKSLNNFDINIMI